MTRASSICTSLINVRSIIVAVSDHRSGTLSSWSSSYDRDLLSLNLNNLKLGRAYHFVFTLSLSLQSNSLYISLECISNAVLLVCNLKCFLSTQGLLAALSVISYQLSPQLSVISYHLAQISVHLNFNRTSPVLYVNIINKFKNNLRYFTFSHMYTRAQVGSPVYMKIKDIPENFIKDDGNYFASTTTYEMNRQHYLR